MPTAESCEAVSENCRARDTSGVCTVGTVCLHYIVCAYYMYAWHAHTVYL